MLRTYFKIALRSLARQKLFGAINIGGLALGIAAAFVLGLYARQELTYDRHYPDHDRIYRIATDFFEMGGFANSQGQMLDELPTVTPIIEASTRFRGGGPMPVAVGDVQYEESEYINVDTSFFALFPYQFVEGSAATALRAPDEVIISDKLAAKYFGDNPALGQVLRVGRDEQTYRVAGVTRTPHGKSHLAADMWLPLKLAEHDSRWTNVRYYNYVKLRDGRTQDDLEQALEVLRRDRAFPTAGFDGSYEAWLATPSAVQFWVQPLTDIYMQSEFNFELAPGGNATQVYSLGLIGLLILLIAGMNYVNLTTAHSSVRAKEVGVKKALGAGRLTLIRQFLAETTALSLFAALIAVVLSEALLQAFTAITGETLVRSVFDNPVYLLALFGVSLVVGLASGVYPALYLASFRPVRILKGEWSLSGRSRLRSALVVTQFAIAIALTIASLVVFRQLDFLQTTDKGFDHTGVVVIDDVDELGSQADAFRQQVAQMPQVEQTSLARRVPLGAGVAMYTYQTPTMTEAVTLQTFDGDEAYIPTLGMRLVAGRAFSRERASDSSAAIVNEAAARVLGLGDDPVGKEINEGQQVIGVVGDFNFQSLRNQIEPVVLTYSDSGDELIVRLNAAGVGPFVSNIPALWNQFAPQVPLRYSFVDERFAELAAKERMLGRAVSFFTVFAILIAAMGLFGLAAFTAARRRKEIGVRKVLGASVPNIAALLTREFLVLVGIAFSVAAPIAFVAMRRWLSGFAYHINVGFGVFVVAGLAAALLAIATVSYQAVRAAIADPVQSLRHE